MIKYRRAWLALPVIGLVVASTTGAAASQGGGSKSPLLLNASGSCLSGATSGTPDGGFAIIHATASGTLIAEVAVKNLTPNHTYTLSLIQTPSGENCFTAEASLTTNQVGNGNVNVQEPLLPGTTGAFILIQPSDGNGFVASSPTVSIP